MQCKKIAVQVLGGAALAFGILSGRDVGEPAAHAEALADCACGAIAPHLAGEGVDFASDGALAFAERVGERVARDPSSAHDVICAIQTLEPRAKRQAAGVLALAQLAAARRDQRAGDQIAAWIRCGDDAFQSAYQTTLAAGGAAQHMVPFSPNEPGGGVVSPSRP